MTSLTKATMKLPRSTYPKIFVAGLLLAGCSATRDANIRSEVSPDKSQIALAFAVDQTLRGKLSTKAQEALSAAESQALDFGQPGESVGWQVSNAKQSGSVIAFQPFRIGESNCRRFVHRVSIEADKMSTSGTACREDGRSWALVE